MSKIRVGFGYDVHKLVEGRDLWLGGIKIEHGAVVGNTDDERIQLVQARIGLGQPSVGASAHHYGYGLHTYIAQHVDEHHVQISI